jgi:hypothetical protein
MQVGLIFKGRDHDNRKKISMQVAEMQLGFLKPAVKYCNVVVKGDPPFLLAA